MQAATAAIASNLKRPSYACHLQHFSSIVSREEEQSNDIASNPTNNMVKSSATAAATAVFVASFLPGSAAQEAKKLWYPDYSSSYESGRCTDQPSSSLLRLQNYASFGYRDQTTCCQESFPGSNCASDGLLATGTSPDIDFDVDVVFEKLMNDTVAFETYQAEQEKYWSSLSSILTSMYS